MICMIWILLKRKFYRNKSGLDIFRGQSPNLLAPHPPSSSLDQLLTADGSKPSRGTWGDPVIPSFYSTFYYLQSVGWDRSHSLTFYPAHWGSPWTRGPGCQRTPLWSGGEVRPLERSPAWDSPPPYCWSSSGPSRRCRNSYSLTVCQSLGLPSQDITHTTTSTTVYYRRENF